MINYQKKNRKIFAILCLCVSCMMAFSSCGSSPGTGATNSATTAAVKDTLSEKGSEKETSGSAKKEASGKTENEISEKAEEKPSGKAENETSVKTGNETSGKAEKETTKEEKETAKETAKKAEKDSGKDKLPIYVLYTNDVHCGIKDNAGYSGLASLKEGLEKTGAKVLLVDCGDNIQGDVIGTLSKGEYPVEIMNKIGYNAAALGNHEFDYGMEQFNKNVSLAKFPYVSCNFVDKDEKSVLSPYSLVDIGGKKIAFLGITTPKTMSSTSPRTFEDENGNTVYGFCQDDTGKKLYDKVQKAADDARKNGAEYVIALSHLGIDETCSPWTSSEVITNTSGIDVFLDGHSHSVVKTQKVKNKDGQRVLLTQTGTKLQNIGLLTISADGKFSSELIGDDELYGFIEEKYDELKKVTEEVVAHSDVKLIINDPEAKLDDGSPVRIIRTQETNLGDLCADAYRNATGADIAIVNGGGIRAELEGDITYGDIISVHPFGNMLCMVETDGQTILDALELSVSGLPSEFGGFLQVSGITFDVNMNVESTVMLDDDSMFVGVTGERRVSNVMVGGNPIDREAKYTVASHNFLLKDGGDGYSMFKKNSELLLDSIMLDNQVVITYITEALGGNVGENYSEPYGQGRIRILE